MSKNGRGGQPSEAKKSPFVAGFLALFLGPLGAHCAYLGSPLQIPIRFGISFLGLLVSGLAKSLLPFSLVWLYPVLEGVVYFLTGVTDQSLLSMLSDGLLLSRLKAGISNNPSAVAVGGTVMSVLFAMGLVFMASAPFVDASSSSASSGERVSSGFQAGKESESSDSSSGRSLKTDDEKDSSTETELEDLRVSFIDVGQGDATLVILPDGRSILVDAGPDVEAKAVLQELSNEGVHEKIDYLVLTHPDADHITGAEAVLSQYEVGEIIAPKTTHTTDSYLQLLQAIKDKGMTITAANAGDVIAYGDSFSAKILWPSDSTSAEETNDLSIVLILTYGENSVLLTGDAPKETLSQLNCGHVDVLKVSHHGSDTGTDASLVSALAPSYAVISYAVGNDYGHPTQTVLDALSIVDHVYGTGVNGTVRLRSDGSSISVTEGKTGVVVAPVSQEESEVEGGTEETSSVEEAVPAEDASDGTSAQTTSTDGEKTVVITASGKRFHARGCRTLKKSKNLTELTKDEALARGYTSCGVCNP